MKRNIFFALLAVVFMAAFLVETAAGVDIYTFRRERVDQELEGNRGYIVGSPPPVEERGPRKRTLIGIDIELPFFWRRDPGEEAYVEADKAPLTKETALVGETPVTERDVQEEKDRWEDIDDGWIDDDWIK